MKVKFFRNSFPLIVRWDVTARCPLRCKYCGIWEKKIKELDTARIFELIDEMAAIGVKKISFSGGEPLLRDDICAIVNYAKHKRISPEMNTAGFLFPEKADQLGQLDLLKISLDGPAEINNIVRGGKQAFVWATDAARYARQNGIKFIFCSTLTGYNMNYVEDILKLAEDFGTQVRFQPLKDIRYLKYSNFVDNKDPKLIPSRRQYKAALDTLIKYSRKNSTLISNSYQTLRHIYNWPTYPKLKCWAGKVFCMISPAGDVSPCDRLFYKTDLPNCAEISFKKAVKNLPDLPFCAGCGFLGSLALNYLMNFKFDNFLMKKVIT
ncbi:radical SAM/SPASM domain-containing protein [Candidatus Omnitrophota bacterium]